jgi:type IV pilus biogenesis protein CpaD/CtpE
MKKNILLVSLVGFIAGCASTPRDSVPVTTININPTNHTVSLSNPKDTTINNFKATVSNGVETVSWDSLTTTMNPDVVQMSGESYAKAIAAQGQAIQGILGAAGQAAGSAAGAVVKP